MYFSTRERRQNRADPTGEIAGWQAILNNLAMTYGDRLGLN
jgi:putative transposase